MDIPANSNPFFNTCPKTIKQDQQLVKREVDQDPELESLSDWVRTIRSLVQGRIHKLKNCVNSRPKSVFKDQ